MNSYFTVISGILVLATTSFLFADDSSIPVKVVYDNYVFDEDLESDWGFACVVTGLEETILFDTGSKGDLLLANMEKMCVKPNEIDLTVISHNHRDHTGGLLPFLKKNRGASVFVPADTPDTFIEDARKLAQEVTVVSQPTKICEGAVVLGPMGDKIVEQSLVLETEKGLVIVTGCSHPGIVTIARRAKEEFEREIYMVLGGPHLLRHSKKELETVIEDLKELGVQKVAATHCSGDQAISMLNGAFGDGFVKMGVGRVVEINER